MRSPQGDLETLMRKFGAEARRTLKGRPEWDEAAWLRFFFEWMEARTAYAAGVPIARYVPQPPSLREVATDAHRNPEFLTKTARGPREWISVEKAAEIAGVSKWTVRGWLARDVNPLPHRQPFPRARIRISLKALIAWIEQATD